MEIEIVKWANSWIGTSEFVDWSIIFRAQHLLYIVIIAPFLFYSFDKNRTRVKFAILHAFLAGILSRFVFTEIVRLFYDRQRPFEVLDGLSALINHSGGGSFPSGHAAFSFAVAIAIFYYYPKTSILFFLAAINIGFARIAAGLHWPIDILGGAIVGISAAWLVGLLIKKFKS